MAGATPASGDHHWVGMGGESWDSDSWSDTQGGSPIGTYPSGSSATAIIDSGGSGPGGLGEAIMEGVNIYAPTGYGSDFTIDTDCTIGNIIGEDSLLTIKFSGTRTIIINSINIADTGLIGGGGFNVTDPFTPIVNVTVNGNFYAPRWSESSNHFTGTTIIGGDLTAGFKAGTTEGGPVAITVEGNVVIKRGLKSLPSGSVLICNNSIAGTSDFSDATPTGVSNISKIIFKKTTSFIPFSSGMLPALEFAEPGTTCNIAADFTFEGNLRVLGGTLTGSTTLLTWAYLGPRFGSDTYDLYAESGSDVQGIEIKSTSATVGVTGDWSSFTNTSPFILTLGDGSGIEIKEPFFVSTLRSNGTATNVFNIQADTTLYAADSFLDFSNSGTTFTIDAGKTVTGQYPSSGGYNFSAGNVVINGSLLAPNPTNQVCSFDGASVTCGSSSLVSIEQSSGFNSGGIGNIFNRLDLGISSTVELLNDTKMSQLGDGNNLSSSISSSTSPKTIIITGANVSTNGIITSSLSLYDSSTSKITVQFLAPGSKVLKIRAGSNVNSIYDFVFNASNNTYTFLSDTVCAKVNISGSGSNNLINYISNSIIDLGSSYPSDVCFDLNSVGATFNTTLNSYQVGFQGKTSISNGTLILQGHSGVSGGNNLVFGSDYTQTGGSVTISELSSSVDEMPIFNSGNVSITGGQFTANSRIKVSSSINDFLISNGLLAGSGKFIFGLYGTLTSGTNVFHDVDLFSFFTCNMIIGGKLTLLDNLNLQGAMNVTLTGAYVTSGQDILTLGSNVTAGIGDTTLTIKPVGDKTLGMSGSWASIGQGYGTNFNYVFDNNNSIVNTGAIRFYSLSCTGTGTGNALNFTGTVATTDYANNDTFTINSAGLTVDTIDDCTFNSINWIAGTFKMPNGKSLSISGSASVINSAFVVNKKAGTSICKFYGGTLDLGTVDVGKVQILGLTTAAAANTFSSEFKISAGYLCAGFTHRFVDNLIIDLDIGGMDATDSIIYVEKNVSMLAGCHFGHWKIESNDTVQLSRWGENNLQSVTIGSEGPCSPTLTSNSLSDFVCSSLFEIKPGCNVTFNSSIQYDRFNTSNFKSVGTLVNPIILTSAAPWYLIVSNQPPSSDIQYTTVSYSDASGGAAIDATDLSNTDGGYNIGWTFSSLATTTTTTASSTSSSTTISSTSSTTTLTSTSSTTTLTSTSSTTTLTSTSSTTTLTSTSSTTTLTSTSSTTTLTSTSSSSSTSTSTTISTSTISTSTYTTTTVTTTEEIKIIRRASYKKAPLNPRNFGFPFLSMHGGKKKGKK